MSISFDKSKLLGIGIQKRNGELPKETTWQFINENYANNSFADGEQVRIWVKNQLRNKKNSNTTTQVDANTHSEAMTLQDVNNAKEKFREEFEIKSDGTHVSSKLLDLSLEELSLMENKSVEFLLKSHGYDPSEWELVSTTSRKWGIYSKIDKIQTLYASKVTAKPRKDELSLENVKSIFAEMSKTYISPIHVPTRYNENGKMLELSIADLHLGKLCWSGDSNDTYNFEIARKRFFHIINDVLTKTENQKFEKIIFVWSNDFFHYDNLASSTTAGTKQDTDLKLAQMFKIGVKMLIDAIDMLSKIAPVETFYVGSNHDKLMSYFATEYLYAWFRNSINITVDADPKIRKYIEFGKCLIQFSHGHAEGKRIGDVMSVEERAAWGRCPFTEVHAGHFHSERTITKDNGVVVRYLGSPTGTDTWHYESGYVSAIKRGQSFVWDRENGLEQAIYTTIHKEV